MRKKVLGLIMTVALAVSGVIGLTAAVPVRADCVPTSIIGDGQQYCDDGQGGGVYEILAIVLNVLTIGVGILGTLGIVIAGIQYLTAGDNEQQVATAKKRIIEVVIGLAIYAVMYVALSWLIPGGIFNNGS